LPEPAGIQDALAAFERRCRDLSVPLTVQRRAVLSALLARDDHPTPEDVFLDVRARLPGISRGTTYRTLDKLVALGLVVRVCHHGAVARYDAKTHRHHHLVCDRCDAVVDLEHEAYDCLPLPDLSRAGFRLRDYSVHLRGLCQRCTSEQARVAGRGSRTPGAARRPGSGRRRSTPAGHSPTSRPPRPESNRRRKP
jgi:Fe2+ or Zn2+ uptake regulation protein